MPRARSPNREKAFELWAKSDGKRQLKDIAAELGVSDVQVRKWKNQDGWDAKRGKGTLPKKASKAKGNVTKPKRHVGAPKGNQNAKGHGAPRGNQNRLIHGIYSQTYWDTLSEEERDMLEEEMEYDTEWLLQRQIDLLTVRERRLMKRINEYREKNGGLYVASVYTSKERRDFADPEEAERYEELKRGKQREGKISYFGAVANVATNANATIDLIQRLESELTRVQAQKTKCIRELADLRLEREKLDRENAGNEIADDWIAAMMEVDNAKG